MSRKDYELIAHVLKDAHLEYDAKHAGFVVNGIAARFAEALAADNPRFDSPRFLRACGPLSALGAVPGFGVAV